MMRPLNVGLENPGDGEADAPITDVVLTDGTEGYRGGGVDVTSLTIADEEGPAMPRPLADTLALAVLAVVVPVSVEAVGAALRARRLRADAARVLEGAELAAVRDRWTGRSVAT